MWSKLMLVRTATSPSTTLVQSHRPPRPDLDDGHVDRLVGEPGQGGRGEQLEPGRALLHHGSSRASDSSTSTKAASSMGSPLRARRSLTRLRLGLV